MERGGGFVAAAFRHRTSRAGDPQLHTHVLVANLGRGPDGRWSALDARQLYAQARVASFVYQAVLRGELTRGWALSGRRCARGSPRWPACPRDVMRAFSRRRAEIEAALEERGTEGARAAEAAALATRRVKGPRSKGRRSWCSGGDARLRLGFGVEESRACSTGSRVRWIVAGGAEDRARGSARPDVPAVELRPARRAAGAL